MKYPTVTGFPATYQPVVNAECGDSCTFMYARADSGSGTNDTLMRKVHTLLRDPRGHVT